MSKKGDKILEELAWAWHPCINPIGFTYKVSDSEGGEFLFEHYGNAELFAGELGKDGKRKPKILNVASDESPCLNPNLKEDFHSYWKMWARLSKYAESIKAGEAPLPFENRMMIAAYVAGLWFFRKTMRRIEENHQELLREIRKLKGEQP